MVSITVIVDDVTAPGPQCASAIARARAAAKRCGDQASVDVVAADSDEAAQMGASATPTVAVDGLVLSVGRAAPAGHIMRAVELALEDD